MEEATGKKCVKIPEVYRFQASGFQQSEEFVLYQKSFVENIAIRYDFLWKTN